MSRLSRANLKSRESIFAGGPDLYRGDAQARCPPDLEECVMAMEDCCEEAYESQVLLRNGTKDLARMTKVMQNERVFVLVNESTIKKYKSALADEIEPAVMELIESAEQGLASLERQEAILRTKTDTAKLRAPTTGITAVQKLEARRLQTLVRQREKLEAEIRALEDEVLKMGTKGRP